MKDASNRYQMWLSLQKEINQHKINIDRGCFRKTPEERIRIKEAKKEWKKQNS